MQILADPSELRDGTRLHPALVERCKVLPGLEDKTGADLLLSPLPIPATSDALLRRHCESGVLVQRKTGTDFCNSVINGRLSQQGERMREWGQGWLVIVGQMGVNAAGEFTIDGKGDGDWRSIHGFLDWWQLKGLFWATVPDDEALIWWVDRWPQAFKVRDLGQAGTFLRKAPGIGLERACALLEQGTLAHALSLLSDEARTGELPPGIREGIQAKAREWLGLQEGEFLQVGGMRGWQGVAEALMRVDPDTESADEQALWATVYSIVAHQCGLPCTSHDTWAEWLKAGWSMQLMHVQKLGSISR